MISLTHETRGREVRLEVFYLDFQTCGWNTGNRSFHGWSWVLYERKTPCNFLSRRSRREKLRFKELGIACLAGIRSKMRCRCRRGLTRSMGTVLDGSTTGYCSSFRFPQPLFSYFLTKICFFPPLSPHLTADFSNGAVWRTGSIFLFHSVDPTSRGSIRPLHYFYKIRCFYLGNNALFSLLYH